MPYDTLYPPPPESDMGETDILPTEIQQTFDSIYAVMKEKRRLQHSISTSESSLDGRQSNIKRSRERLDLLDTESLREEKKEDDSESKEIEEGGTGSSNLLEYASSQQDEDLEMRRFEAAVAAAVLIDKEMTRWERGVAELEKLFFERYDDDPGESLLNIPLPFLPFLVPVENASDLAVDVTPTA